MKKIYVCSMVVGGQDYNRKKAIEYTRYVVEQGHIPITPQIYLPLFLSAVKLMDLLYTSRVQIELVKGCDELWYFGDGVTREMVDAILAAREQGIPVKHIPEMKVNVQMHTDKSETEKKESSPQKNDNEIGGKI